MQIKTRRGALAPQAGVHAAITVDGRSPRTRIDWGPNSEMWVIDVGGATDFQAERDAASQIVDRADALMSSGGRPLKSRQDQWAAVLLDAQDEPADRVAAHYRRQAGVPDDLFVVEQDVASASTLVTATQADLEALEGVAA